MQPSLFPSTLSSVSDEDTTYTACVARLFLSRPGEWIDGLELARVGGAYAWRTRVSEVRNQFGLDIENRLRRDGRRIVSEYRLRV